VLVHAEKRGPAFDSANATARLVYAINRGVFLDVMPAWTDLLAALNITPSPLSVDTAYWPEMVDAVYEALLGANGDTRDLLWAAADEQVRAYAKVAAATWQKDAEQTQGGDHWVDVDESRKAEIIAAYGQSARLWAFAKGGR